MTIQELIASLQNPGEDGVNPTVYDDLLAFHTGEVGTRDSKLAEIEAANEALTAKNTQLIEHNYELMMALGNTNDEVDVEGDEDIANDEDADNEEGGVASLFTTDKDND